MDHNVTSGLWVDIHAGFQSNVAVVGFRTSLLSSTQEIVSAFRGARWDYPQFLRLISQHCHVECEYPPVTISWPPTSSGAGNLENCRFLSFFLALGFVSIWSRMMTRLQCPKYLSLYGWTLTWVCSIKSNKSEDMGFGVWLILKPFHYLPIHLFQSCFFFLGGGNTYDWQLWRPIE